MPPRRPSNAAPTTPSRTRDHAREAAGRATSLQVKFAMTPEERAELDALAAALGAPMKASVLGAVRAAQALLEGATVATAKRLLQADLAPRKPGPKTEHDE